MKKLLLLSTLLIFACSSDDNNESQNSTNSKKLRTFTVINPCLNCEAENGNYSYSDGKLTSIDGEFIVTDENGQMYNGYPSESNYAIEHLPNSIIVNDNGNTEIFQTNNDGTILSENIEFDNGYLQRIDDVYYNWSNGNLMGFNGGANISDETTVVEYTDFDDLTGHLGIIIATGNFIFFTEDNLISILGLLGNSTQKLPHTVTTTSVNNTFIKTYTYLLSDDGYPFQIILENTNTYSSGEVYNSTRRFQLIYN
ncbi:MAG: hypothetical protein ACON5K_02405 [Bacteroidia bacterium]